MGIAYVSATGSAVVTAIGLKTLLARVSGLFFKTGYYIFSFHVPMMIINLLITPQVMIVASMY